MKQIFIFILTLLMLNYCNTTEERVNEKFSSYSAEVPSLKIRPGRFAIEVKDEVITGTTSYSSSLGFSSKEFPGVVQQVRAFNLTNPTIHTTNASAKAIDSVKADGIYVTDVQEQTTGFFPFFWTVKVTVRGKPVFFRSLGPLPEEKSDFPETSIMKLVQDEIEVLKAAIEKEIGKPIKFSSYVDAPYPKEGERK